MINLQIDVNDQATPSLVKVLEGYRDLREFHRFLALDLAEGTRRHIRDAAKSRHKTRERLGLSPSSGRYLSDAANSVEADGDAEGVSLRVAGAIFKRVNGPVTITPREKKYLTIPLHKDALGRKAEEIWFRNDAPRTSRRGKRPRLIIGLVMIKSKKGNLLLARANADGSITPYYALKTQVTLPQDTGLLPTPEQLGRLAERTASWYLDRQMKKAGLA